MKLPDLFKSILDHYLKVEETKLVFRYLSQEDNRRNKIKKTLSQLIHQDQLENLRPEIAIFKSYSDTKLALVIALLNPGEKKIVTILRKEISRKIRNDIIHFLCLTNLLTSFHLSSMDWQERVSIGGLGIAKLVVTYFIILPLFLDKLINNEIVTNYIKHTVSSYMELFNSIPLRQLVRRLDNLLRDDYKELFVKLNKTRTPNVNTQIPSLKNLAAFFVKHNTDIDIDGAPIPDELRDFVRGATRLP